MLTVDVLVIGGGCAGLRAAAEAAGRGGRVLLVNKGRLGRTGCSAFLDHRIEYSLMNIPDRAPDSPERYREDLLACGAGRSDPAVVDAFVEGILEERDFLRGLGLGFRRDGGEPRRVHLPGHSVARSLVTEEGFGRKLLARLAGLAGARGAEARAGLVALALLRGGGRAAGALAADVRSGELLEIRAGAVILAAGGLGNVFPLTTNPPDIAGDGVAMAWRAGVALRDLACIQCYPLTASPARGTYLVSGILLAGHVRNRFDEAFAFDPPAGLTPHVARKARLGALCRWMAEEAHAGRGFAGGTLEWDGTEIPPETYAAQMPATYAALRRAGADLLRDRVRIAPGAHQMLGGLRVDADGATSLPGLYAAGEDMGGLHGADRLSGTGIAEALVFGRRAARAAGAFARAAGAPPSRASLEADWGAGTSGRPAPTLAAARQLEADVTRLMGPLLVRWSPEEARHAAEALQGIVSWAAWAPFDRRRPRASLRMHRAGNLALTARLVAMAGAGEAVAGPAPGMEERS